MNDNSIDKLIQPFIDRQLELEQYVINSIAERVKVIGELSKADVYRLQQLYKIGENARLINKEIARVLNIQETQVKSMIKKVAVETYMDAKPFYDYRHKAQIPLERNIRLQRSIKAVSNQTGGTFKNMSNSKATGFLIRDSKNPTRLKFQTLQETYQSVVDEAIHNVQSGVMDFNTAMRRTLKQLNDSGFRRVYWDSGYSRRLDSVVRMNIMAGVNQLNQQIQLQIADEINADGIELSAHSFSAPDHEPIQGHIFTIDEFRKLQSETDFEDINHNKFDAIPRGIGEWNCRHFPTAIIIAKHKPTWSEEDLEELKEANHSGYELKNGKTLTMYECEQIQRKYETDIRYAKEGYMMAKKAGNDILMEEYKVKIAKLNREYTQFSKDCHLTKQRNRASVSGFSY